MQGVMCSVYTKCCASIPSKRKLAQLESTISTSSTDGLLWPQLILIEIFEANDLIEHICLH